MPPTAEPDTAAATPRASFGTRIVERLPEIVIEALFMLVAVVLAFAVEEWREERDKEDPQLHRYSIEKSSSGR